MSLVDHTSWPLLKPWLEAQEKKRDGGIYRIELRDDAPYNVRSAAIGLMQPCVVCGEPIRPFRWRAAKAQRGDKIAKNIYYGATCKERPDEEDRKNWLALAQDPNTTIQQLKEALLDAANSYKTCCKGKPPSVEYKAIAAALKKP